MPRQRITYQSEALYAGNLLQHEPKQLYRIQTAGHSLDVQYIDVQELGVLKALDRELIESPVVNLDFSYYLMDGRNERTLGFSVEGRDGVVSQRNFLYGLLNDTTDEKNYYLLTAPEREEAANGSSNYIANQNGVLGIGNGYITNYSISAAIGEIPTASITVEATNIRFDINSVNIDNPAIDVENGTAINYPIDIPVATDGMAELSAFILKPGNIKLDFGSKKFLEGGVLLAGMDDAGDKEACVQSFTLDIPIARNPKICLDKFHPIDREIQFPINATLSVTANILKTSEGTLSNIICNPEQERDISIKLKHECSQEDSMVYSLKGAVLTSQGMSSVFNDTKTVDLVFETQIESYTTTTKGVFLTAPTTTTTLPPFEAPESPNSPGLLCETDYDGEYFYVATELNSWQRVAIARVDHGLGTEGETDYDNDYYYICIYDGVMNPRQGRISIWGRFPLVPSALTLPGGPGMTHCEKDYFFILTDAGWKQSVLATWS